MFNGYCWQTRTLEVRLDRLDDGSGLSAGAGFLGAGMNGMNGHASGSGTPVLAVPLSVPGPATMTPRFQDETAVGLGGMAVSIDGLSPSSPVSLSRPETAGGGGTGGGSQISRNLFVGNVRQFLSLVGRVEMLKGSQLPFHIQWQDLKDLFRQAGTILRADVALGADGRSRGFGTVSFAGEADAERAVRMFNG